MYKYVPPERINVLQHGLIRFTQPSALNDPFEFRATFAQVLDPDWTWNEVSTPETLRNAFDEVYDELPPALRAIVPREQLKEMAMAEFEKPESQSEFRGLIQGFLNAANAQLPELHARIPEALDSKIGILSLSDQPDLNLMWSLYADSHRGFVIEFDPDHDFFNRRRSAEDECYWLRPVVYEAPEPIPDFLSVTGEKLFLMKGPEWSHEREWRMLAPLEDADEVIDVDGDRVHLFRFPPDAVRAVILGARATDNVATALGKLVREMAPHIRVHRMEFDGPSSLKLVEEDA